MALPQNMLSIFRQIGPLNDEFLADLDSGLKHIKLKKKEKWLSRGEVCRKVLFLDKGLLYSSLEEEDYTFTVWFMKENDFVISVESYFRQISSAESITVLEDMEGHYMSYNDMQMLKDKHHCFLTVYNALIENYYVLSEARAANLRKREALDRYRFLLRHHPEIIKRVPLKLIASYLCINIETMSRIRRKI